MSKQQKQLETLRWNCRGKNKKILLKLFEKISAEGQEIPTSISESDVGKVYGAVVKCGCSKGVFIYLNVGIEARIKLCELPESPIDPEKVSNFYVEGQILPAVRITHVENKSSRLIEASIRKVFDVFLTFSDLKINDVVATQVKKKLTSGLILQIENSCLHAFCYVKEIHDMEDYSKEDEQVVRQKLLNKYPLNDLLAARIISLDETKKKIWVTLKPSCFDESVVTLQETLASKNRKPKVVTKNQSENPQKVDDRLPIDNGETKETIKNYDSDSSVNINFDEKCDEHGSDDDSINYSTCVSTVLSTLNKGIKKRLEKKRLKRFKTNESDSDDSFSDALADDAVLGAEDLDTTFKGDEEDSTMRSRKRKERRLTTAAKIREEMRVREIEEEDTLKDGVSAETILDFERLIQIEPNASSVWIRYMAYFLKLKDLDRAREVAENALERISFEHESERFNVWVAYLNLEASFGTVETLNDIFRKATQYNNPKQIYLQMTHIYQQRNNVDKCLEYCKKCVDKYPNSKKTWIRYIMCLLELAVENPMDTENNVRGVLLRALNRLSKKKQVDVLCATARAEMKIGSIERGRTYFEKLLDEYPKRTDLWGQYYDALITAVKNKKLSVSSCGPLFHKPIAMTNLFKPRQMKYFFSRWLAFETSYGTEESRAHVMQQAENYVQNTSL
ncbi:uncharacterized protein LOC128883874 [Hylaeus volcanicus]|uniref:uncharacterized protein LOC128883874 n=1 Tax=Hylaeus volcanicus TaxID=313075 RepID=UPI0023B83AEF|nr:uncharacterized protein LOC128883874 [Hylaeus volcanicus]XP_053992699.1 uncharacterized protein LOC128883874 [Hylaeus volcanicus]